MADREPEEAKPWQGFKIPNLTINMPQPVTREDSIHRVIAAMRRHYGGDPGASGMRA